MNFNSFSSFLFARTFRKRENISAGRVTLQLFQIYIYIFSLYHVASVVIRIGCIVCVVSSVLLFSNHRQCLERFSASWVPNTVAFPDLYFCQSPVASIVIRVREIVWVTSFVFSFYNHNPCLARNRASHAYPIQMRNEIQYLCRRHKVSP